MEHRSRARASSQPQALGKRGNTSKATMGTHMATVAATLTQRGRMRDNNNTGEGNGGGDDDEEAENECHAVKKLLSCRNTSHILILSRDRAITATLRALNGKWAGTSSSVCACGDWLRSRRW